MDGSVPDHATFALGSSSAYESRGGHEHTRLRSPFVIVCGCVCVSVGVVSGIHGERKGKGGVCVLVVVAVVVVVGSIPALVGMGSTYLSPNSRNHHHHHTHTHTHTPTPHATRTVDTIKARRRGPELVHTDPPTQTPQTPPPPSSSHTRTVDIIEAPHGGPELVGAHPRGGEGRLLPRVGLAPLGRQYRVDRVRRVAEGALLHLGGGGGYLVWIWVGVIWF
jgi:hypothetical protein